MKMDWKTIQWRHLVLPLAGWRAPLAWCIFHLSMSWIYQAVAIGDTAHPVVPAWLSACLLPSMFPMFYLWNPIGDWLKLYLSDDGVVELFTAINALFWAHLLTWGFSRLAKGVTQGRGDELARA